MKRILLIILVLTALSTTFFAQSPNSFNYQAVIRDNSNKLLINQDVGIKISILDGSASGAVLYSETHAESTNANGIINLKIGEGTYVSGDFNAINWGADEKFLKIEMDASGGNTYSILGAFQLLSVPYALNANTANKLGYENIYSPDTDTLFVVKDHDGNVVFAVFPDGAAVYVNETVKGKVGGFAVSGRSPSKAIEEDYLIVTSDSTRVYVNESSEAKGKVGGFAISGRSPSKGEISSLMNLTKDNYFIGHEAGVNTTEGLYNTFLGYYSGYINSIGSNNIFIGDSTGYQNTSGNDNIFMGFKSGWSNSWGYRNVFIGSESGLENISGRYNVFIGNQAGYSNTTGGANVIIGATSGFYNTEGYYNVFVGNWSGRSNTTGHENIFLGNRSGWNNTEGYKNIFIGSFSGFENILGSNNIFFGDSAGCRNTSADNNIFIGNRSGLANTEGSRNVYIGYQSGYSNQSGYNNVFFGNNSGYSNTTGFKNVFIGDSAGYYSTYTAYNIFIGDKVGYSNTEGISNVIIGATAGKNNTTGRHNTFIGNWSGLYNTTGGYNLFLGDQSGWNNISGSRNVYVGNRAGFYNTDGWNNVFIGNYAGYNEQGSGKLYIDVGETDSTNTLIWGDFTNKILRLNAYVGIGTNPTSALDINGDLTISGTINSSGPLVVDGLKFLNSFGVDSNYISVGNYICFGHPGSSEDFIGYKNNTFYFLDSPGGGDIYDPHVVFGGNVYVDTGYVAIGVLYPTEKLEVGGNIKVTGGSFIDDGTTINAPDYVFEPDYELETIEEHAAFMWSEKHLPAVFSANDISSSEGYNISERREQMLEELEKAHIYIEQLNLKIKGLEEKNDELQLRLNQIEKLLLKN